MPGPSAPLKNPFDYSSVEDLCEVKMSRRVERFSDHVAPSLEPN